ncbi:MAG: hypothetical protein LBS36_03745 [Oscillospiraceae bacterium]|jgi:hypothetical protein|nr:hypothetical protein [Oscillospiraceae bacterium]
MAEFGCKQVQTRSSHLYLLKNNKSIPEDEQTAKKRQMNESVNLRCGVDVEYLELLRKDTGLFVASLAKKLGIELHELRDYISFNKICPISFAQNWELTLWNAKN